jgi:spore germination cell wall hydrolase CwlJ-like protein
MTRDELRTWLSPLPDEAILALTLYGEARGEPIEGIIAVGCVIRNRVNDTKKRWPNTYRGVCLQPWQFSALNVTGGGVNHDRVIAMAKKLLDRKAPPELDEIAWVALGLQRNALKDNTKRAAHYCVATLSPRPKWALGHVPVIQLGHHAFYTGIP